MVSPCGWLLWGGLDQRMPSGPSFGLLGLLLLLPRLFWVTMRIGSGGLLLLLRLDQKRIPS